MIQGETGNVPVIGTQKRTLGMNHEMLERRNRERHGAAALEIHTIKPAIDFATDLRGRLLHGNQIVGHVDHAANCTRAVKDRRGAAHDFDALTEQCAYAWGMIRTDIRDIKDFRAIIQNADAIVRLATNDWAACTGSETTPANAWLRFERVA